MSIISASSLSAVELAPEHAQVVSQNCVSAQVSLQRLQYSDAATRINRGYIYESLLNDLMTPMNSRLAVNGYSKEAATLNGITDRYQSELRQFKQSYESYDETTRQMIKLKCQEKVSVFYDGVRSLQEKRLKIYTSVNSLDVLTDEYYKAVKQTQKQVTEQ
jgi:hypothetical protein